MPRTLHKYTCEWCCAPFKRRYRTRGNPFCTKACGAQATAHLRVTAPMIRATLERADKIRGTGSRGYVKLNGRHEHRVVAERMLGRQLAKGEIVHHLDGNKRNNDPSNLVVMTQGEHMREHGLGIKGMVLHWKPWEHRRPKS